MYMVHSVLSAMPCHLAEKDAFMVAAYNVHISGVWKSLYSIRRIPLACHRRCRCRYCHFHRVHRVRDWKRKMRRWWCDALYRTYLFGTLQKLPCMFLLVIFFISFSDVSLSLQRCRLLRRVHFTYYCLSWFWPFFFHFFCAAAKPLHSLLHVAFFLSMCGWVRVSSHNCSKTLYNASHSSLSIRIFHSLA